MCGITGYYLFDSTIKPPKDELKKTFEYLGNRELNLNQHLNQNNVFMIKQLK